MINERTNDATERAFVLVRAPVAKLRERKRESQHIAQKDTRVRIYTCKYLCPIKHAYLHTHMRTMFK